MVDVVLQYILPSETDANLYADIKMTHRDASIQRDWEKLINIQIALINRTMEMMHANQLIVPVDPEIAADIDKILLEKLGYIQLAKTPGGSYVITNKKYNYKRLLQILWKYHLMYQNFHEGQWFDKDLYQVGQ